MSTLTGKVAIVTGASQGIGQAVAERLGRDGAAVLVAYEADGDRANAERVVQTIIAAAGAASAAPCDITDVQQIDALFATCVERHGRPDILVSNAGVSTLVPLQEITEPEFYRVFDTNAKGTLFMLKGAAQHLNDGGRVINISSSTTMFPVPGAAIYAGSKAAVKEYTEVAAAELAPRKITVNTVMPGVTETPMTTRLPDQFKDMVIRDTPLSDGKLGQARDIADAVAFLVADDSRWVTGQHLLVNGGANH